MRLLSLLAITLACSYCSKEVVGPGSVKKDDAKSVAKCPDGYTVSSCIVGTADFRSTSDGATLENNGGSCVAHSSWNKGAVKAKAVCSANKNFADPCGGCKNLPLYKYVSQRAASAKAQCPNGYKRVQCIAHSYWAPGSKFTGLNKFDKYGKLKDPKQACSVTCTASNPCTVTAICRLEVDSDAYVKAVCEEAEGTASVKKDDAKSVARCPVGFTVSSCIVGTADFRSTSDGATLENNGGSCVAHSSWNKGAVKAKASCSVQKIYDHPCGGSQKLPLYEYVSQRAASAKAQCSKGYKRIQCIAHSYWAPGSQFTGLNKFDKYGKLKDPKQACSVTCTASNPCTVTAICKLEVDSDKYKAAACPSCDGYKCDNGKICVMDGSKHICWPKAVGCEL